MIVVVFRRRLKPGKTFEDFLEAWQAEKGFGVPARVVNALSPDGREVLSVGVVAIDLETQEGGLGQVQSQEAVRHDRIAEVVETSDRAVYDLRTEHDLTGRPLEIPVGSLDSLLYPLAHGPRPPVPES